MEKKVLGALLYVLIFPALVLVLSGDLVWLEGWVFALCFTVLCSTTILYLCRKDPALLEERYRQPGEGNQAGWDRLVVYGLFVGFILRVVVMPLDAKRFGWSPVVPLGLQVVGGAMHAGSGFLFFRSYADNTFLSPLVRIQEEREQQVVSTGVYGFVRHPMYLGAVLMFIGAPLLLGSLYGGVVGVALTVPLAARIVGAEAMLVRELDGYREYVRTVRFRLVPYLW